MTGIQKHFLGWDNPFLTSASKWLQENYLQDELGSSDSLIVLVPGKAIARNLQSIFISEATKNGRALKLPNMGTTSQFFRTCIPKSDQIADQATILLATSTVLQGMPPNKVTSIVGPRRPRDDDFIGWSQVAQLVWATIKTASGGGLSIDSSTWPERARLMLTEHAVERFSVLQTIQLKVQELLAVDGLHIFELKQLELLNPDCELELCSLQHVVVVGASDLAGVATKLFDRLLLEGVSIDVLIRAPESESSGFDSYGCIDTTYWMDASIDINDDDIVVAGSPSSQSAEVVRGLAALQDVATADQITIAATDEQLIPIIQRHVRGHGVRSRFAGGIPVIETSQALLVSGIAEFISSQSYDAYAALVRHPDIVQLLGVKESVLESLSRYSMDVVPSRIEETSWFEPKNTYFNMDGLPELHKQVIDLCQPCLQIEKKATSIRECSTTIREFLLQVYGVEILDSTDIKLKTLQEIFKVLDNLDSLPESINNQIGSVRISDVFRFLLKELDGTRIQELPDSEAIDTVGWLEVMAVDSPHLIIVGMNPDLGGGNNPSDAFFPDSVRNALDLETIDKRMARDAHAIVAMQHARSNLGSIKWIVGRKNTDGDPLSPSPLLMRCKDSKELAKRSGELVVSFDREKPEVPPQYNPSKEEGGIQIPKPSEYPPREPLQKVSVTALKDYISCRYRFWLKHVMKLNVSEEGNTELDAKLFGSFVHTVLQRFGEDKNVKNSTDCSMIEKVLFDALDCVARDQLGRSISGKVKIQMELARYRLKEFAKHQAQSVADGWTILCTEKKVKKKLIVEGKGFTVSGVIDRIEVHTDGRIRVLDYKTGSTTANKAHFNKEQWLDLQLPLYQRLLSEVPELKEFNTDEDNVLLGYFKIGDQESSIGIDLLTPTSTVTNILQDTIDGIILSILNNEYGEQPIVPAPKYSETYSWICQDNSVVEEASDDYH